VSIEKLEKELGAGVRWRCFPLHPEIPEEGIPIARLFHASPAQIAAHLEPLRQKAAELGLRIGRLDTIFNSRLAQELGKWAEFMERGDAFHGAVFRAYLQDGKNIADPGILLDLAESAGLPRTEAEMVLKERALKEAVDRDWAEARRLEIRAVPTVISDALRLVGYQPYERMAREIRQSRPGAAGPRGDAGKQAFP
jgi:predicted DsbA family dithiol-disulfide isomerase